MVARGVRGVIARSISRSTTEDVQRCRTETLINLSDPSMYSKSPIGVKFVSALKQVLADAPKAKKSTDTRVAVLINIMFRNVSTVQNHSSSSIYSFCVKINSFFRFQ